MKQRVLALAPPAALQKGRHTLETWATVEASLYKVWGKTLRRVRIEINCVWFLLFYQWGKGRRAFHTPHITTRWGLNLLQISRSLRLWAKRVHAPSQMWRARLGSGNSGSLCEVRESHLRWADHTGGAVRAMATCAEDGRVSSEELVASPRSRGFRSF